MRVGAYYRSGSTAARRTSDCEPSALSAPAARCFSLGRVVGCSVISRRAVRATSGTSALTGSALHRCAVRVPPREGRWWLGLAGGTAAPPASHRLRPGPGHSCAASISAWRATRSSAYAIASLPRGRRRPFSQRVTVALSQSSSSATRPCDTPAVMRMARAIAGGGTRRRARTSSSRPVTGPMESRPRHRRQRMQQ